MKEKNYRTIKLNKFFILAIVFLFAAIIAKMSFVALATKVDGTDLKVFADNRNTTQQTLYANRGNIFDKNGEILAQNVNSYTVIAFLNENRTSDPSDPQHVVDKDKTAEELSKILPNMPKDKILALLNQEGLYQVELGPGGRGISELLKSQIEALDLPGIGFISSTKRWYKMGSFAPYVIGYARTNEEGEIVGEMGIEQYFNDELKGIDGYTEYQKDAYGYQIPNTNPIVVDPSSGSDIYLTLDNEIQLILENAVNELSSKNKLNWITMNVMDAKTGAIVGTASDPSFDLNTLEIESYLNPLTSYQYEPGSTMKIFSFMAAMENGIYKGDEMFDSGSIKIGNTTIRDFNRTGWGTIDYDTGFAYSSNVAATNLGMALGKEKLTDFYKKLGFGKKTGIELPEESAGTLKLNYDIELANASFGQGVTTTPVQNLQALSTLANDGVMIKPYIVEKIVDSNTKETTYQAERTELGKVVSSETISKMKDLLYKVVYDGLADTKNFQPKNVTLIGKTGTAQIASAGGYLTGSYDYVRSFAGLFPKEDPKYIIYISVKQFEGKYRDVQKTVANVVEEIAKTKYLTENASDIDQSKIITTENYIGLFVEDTQEKLKKQGLIPVILGSGKYITNQYPLKNLTLTAGNKVFLLTNKDDYTMADVTGWSSSEIITFCHLLNIPYEIKGYGYVKEVNVLKDTKITKETKLIITLEDNSKNNQQPT